MNKTRARRGLDATALQVARAYEQHYGEKMDPDMTIVSAAYRLAADLGHDEARRLIMGQSNDPDT